MNAKSTLTALNQEIERFLNTINVPTSKHTSKSVNLLKSIWRTYRPKVKGNVYTEKILTLGEFLSTQKCFKLAAFHCYGHYLHNVFLFGIDDVCTLDTATFISTFIDGNTDVVNTLRCLIGYSSSYILHMISIDDNLQSKKNIENIVGLLKLMQISMQMSLMKDQHCWLVFNGTIHIHAISKTLMAKGFSSRVLDYLIWACVSMESSVPLMTVKYLGWRTQLYATTCLCFYDLRADEAAENFAKRGLVKIDELNEIEKISISAASPEVDFTFKQARIKLKVMVFKRNVFESRRRPKGVLRPKMKPLLKDIVNNQWPRTGTERMLADQYRGRAAQFLAIVETLSNSNRRIGQTSAGAPESDESVYDVFLELFFAGMEIAAGGGGIKPTLPGKHEKPLNNVTNELSLIDLATAESKIISLKSVLRFLKLAYNYESWDTFDTLIQPVIEELEKYPQDEVFVAERKITKLLAAAAVINPSRIRRKFVMLKAEDNGETNLSKNYKASHTDEVLQLALCLKNIIEQNNLKYYHQTFHDILVDVVLTLWVKCKNHFVKVNSDSFDTHKHIYQDPLFFKWLQTFIITHSAMVKLKVAMFDACACAEATLKLSFIMLCVSNNNDVKIERSRSFSPDSTRSHVQEIESTEKKPDEVLLKTNLLSTIMEEISTFLHISNQRSSLVQHCCDMLLLSLQELNDARDVMLNEPNSIADDSFEDREFVDDNEPIKTSILKLKSYHMEIMYLHHQLQLQISPKVSSENVSKKKMRGIASRSQISTPQDFNTYPPDAGKNDLSKALYLMSLAFNSKEIQGNSKLIQEAYKLLEKARASEEKTKKENESKKKSPTTIPQTSPPPPLLIHRGSSTMTFKPPPFQPSSGEKVASYCLFLRNAAGNNVKVRTSDTTFPGTGEKIPYSKDCVFTVNKLVPNEKYMAVIGAFNEKGDLIGGSIGSSGRPVLAAHPLSLILGYGYLARVSYQKDEWKVAKAAVSVLWNHFVGEKEEIVKDYVTINNDFKLKPKRIKLKSLELSSEIVQRYFVESIFISVDIATKEGKFFYDSITDGDDTRKNQICRLHLCEQLLIALEMSGWLNDNHFCLQSIVQIYSLLSPIVYWKTPVQSAFEVVSYVYGCLQELQSMFKKKRHTATTDALLHMVSCLVYHIATVLVNNGKKPSALQVLDFGSKLLTQMTPPDSATPTMISSIPGGGGGGGGSVGGVAAVISGETANVKKIHQKRTSKRTTKTKGVLKSTSDLNNGGLTSEARAIEIYTTKLLKEGATDGELELTGGEDSVVLNAVIATLPTIVAYREVLKFKRRTHFLESFIGVLSKAYNDRMFDSALEWTRDAVAWLTRRNEIILNKTTQEATKGIVIVANNSNDEDKVKRFAASIVEYGKRSSLGSEVSRESNDNTLDVVTIVTKGTSNTKLTNMKKMTILTSEEKKAKDAAARVQAILPDVWKIMQRRKKLRNVSHEELPWRCQMNFVTAKCNFNICLDKFYLMARRLGYPNLKLGDNMMDFSWFTVSTSGVMMVSWAGCMKDEVELRQKPIDLGGKTVAHEKAPEYHLAPSVSKHSVTIKVDKKHSAKMTSKPVNQHLDTLTIKQDDARKLFIQHVELCFLSFQRALVLAHRGYNWVLLQHVANKLLQCTCTLMTTITLLNNNIDTTKHDIPYTVVKLREIIHIVFYMAGEFLLDFLAKVKLSKQRNQSNSLGIDFDEKNSESDYDNVSSIDYGNIKRVVMFSVEVLFYEEKWEKLCSLIVKFNAITNDRFCTSLLPILIYGQRCLYDRIQSSPKPSPKIIFDPHTGFPIEIEMMPVTPVPIEVGAHIDPEGHELYQIPDDGFRYAIAPFDFEETLQRFRNAFDRKLYTIKQLEHARLLTISYLAGKQGVMKNEGKMANQESTVSFVATEVKPPSYEPEELQHSDFSNIEDLECYPLLEDSQLSVIVMSYERVIETLNKTKQTELATQAMHELGNIMYHAQNIRSAYKWWSNALDNILQTTDSQNNWKKFVDVNDRTVLSAKRLVERCGVKGCLLGGIIATDIAKYIQLSNHDVCIDICHLAASFFKALFCASLCHPSSYHDYMTYDISQDNAVTQIVPGLDLFSNPHQIHCGNLTSSVVWLATHLIRNGFHVQTQPLLTLGHYLCTTVCEDLTAAVEVKLLRVESLCALNKFSEAFHHFHHVASGKKLPNPADFIRVKVHVKLMPFTNSSMSEGQNYNTLQTLRNISFIQAPYTNLYGKDLCYKITLAQVKLLIRIAECILMIPKETANEVTSPTKEAADKSTKDSPVHSTKSNEKKVSNKKSKEKQNLVHMTDVKTIRLEDLKHDLLKTARTLTNDILKFIVVPKKGVIRKDELELLVKCHILLSRIEDARFHLLGAADHLHQCLMFMNRFVTNNHVTTENSENLTLIELRKSKQKTYDQRDSIVDSLTWLQCRQQMSYYLSQEDDAVGRLAGSSLSFVGRVGNVQEYIENSLTECDIFNDSSTKFRLEFTKIQVDLKSGKNPTQLLDMLRNLHTKLTSNRWLSSIPTVQLTLEVQVLIGDLNSLLNPDDVQTALQNYTDIEDYILQELLFQGYDYELSSKFPVASKMNVHLTAISDFLSIKVRLYRVKARMIAQTNNERTHVDEWSRLLKNIDSCLTIFEKMTNKDLTTKVELVLLKGEIQRCLYERDVIDMASCMESFIGVINLCKSFTLDLSLIRQCYNEIALTFSHALKLRETPMTPEIFETEGLGTPKNRRRSSAKLSHKTSNTGNRMSASKDTHRMSRAAWVSVRTAGVIAKAQRKCELLAGETSITTLPMEQQCWEKIPSFVIEDLTGVENADELKCNEDILIKFNSSTDVEITWVHLLKYFTHLRRYCSYSSLALGDFDKALVRVPFKSHVRAIKLSAMCRYLDGNLPVFSKECVPIFPIDLISSLLASVVNKKTSGNDVSQPVSPMKGAEIPENQVCEDIGESVDVSSKPAVTPEKVGDRKDTLFVRNPLQAGECEIAVQWFKPELSPYAERDRIIMLVAMNTRPIAGNSTSVNFSQVASLFHTVYNQYDSVSLHEELVELMQTSEGDLNVTTSHSSRNSVGASVVTAQAVNKMTASVSGSVSQVRRAKNSTPTKSVKNEKDEELKTKMLPIVVKISDFLKTYNNLDEQTIAMEMTWPNLLCLENMFNPSLGHISRVTDTFYTWFLDNFNRMRK